MWQGAVVGAIVDAVKFERNMYEAKRAEQRARDWQREMASSAHQLEVQDLRKAGLNPILSANRGASMGAPIQANLPQGGGPDVSSALAVAREAQALQQDKIRTDYLKGGKSVYDNNPAAKKAVDGANMAQENGLNPNVGAGFNTASSAKSLWQKAETKIQDTISDYYHGDYDRELQKPSIRGPQPITVK